MTYLEICNKHGANHREVVSRVASAFAAFYEDTYSFFHNENVDAHFKEGIAFC